MHFFNTILEDVLFFFFNKAYTDPCWGSEPRFGQAVWARVGVPP